MRWLLVPLAAIAAVVALAMPSGGEAGTPPVKVTLGDFTVGLDRTTVAPGRVRFETSNSGRVEHELLIVRTDLAPDAFPLGLEGPSLELAGKLVLGTPHVHGERDSELRKRHIAPGRSRRDAVELKPGRYVLLCNLPGHYEAGQSARLVVG